MNIYDFNGCQIVEHLFNILLLILGCLLGLLSNFFIEGVKRRKLSKETLNGIAAELDELNFRLLVSLFSLDTKFGCPGKKDVEWIYDRLIKCKGINNDMKMANIMKQLFDLDDEEFEFAKKSLGSKTGAVSLKKYYCPFLQSKIGALSSFSIINQRLIFEIMTKINLINEEICEAQYYHKLTFDSSLSDENSTSVTTNLQFGYSHIIEQSKGLINKICEFQELS